MGNRTDDDVLTATNPWEAHRRAHDRAAELEREVAALRAERGAFFEAVGRLTCPHLARDASAYPTLAEAVEFVIGYLDQSKARVERERGHFEAERDRLRAALQEWADYFRELEAGDVPDDPLAQTRNYFHGERLARTRAALAPPEAHP